MEIIITRHGETVANGKNVIQGQTQGKLSPRGIMQASRLAKKLRHKRIDVVFSSDLKRASDTAYEIALQHGVPVYHIKWLRGRHSGACEGKRWDDVVGEIGRERAFWDVNYKLGGGESLVEMRDRIARFIDAIKKGYGDSTVLICTHRHCIGVILSVLFDVQLGDMLYTLKDIKNAEIIGNAEDVHIYMRNGRACYTGKNKNVLAITACRKTYIS